jgi:predicted nucleic acid-binding protein
VATAYVDTSCLVAIALGERGSEQVAGELDAFDGLLSSSLLEAELLATLAREDVGEEPAFLGAIGWVLPDRPLSREIRRVLAAGRGRGADVLHLATALYVAEDPRELTFATLDQRQQELAQTLGFPALGR